MSQSVSTSTDTRPSQPTAPVDPAAPRLPVAVRDLVLLGARVLLGVILIAHGLQKLLTNGIAGTAAGFEQGGVPLPLVSAGFAAGVETLGGLLLVLGLLTPLVGLLVAGVMAGAFWFVHMGQGLFAADGGWELVAVIGLAALTFAVTGPGRFSLDALLGRRRS